MNLDRIYLLLTLFLLFPGYDLYCQQWEFVKEKDGIKLFTRTEPNSSFNAYKGEITFKAPVEKVNLLVGDANNLDWWGKDISYIKVLNFKKNQLIQYYIIYSVSGPFSNRDLSLEARISVDPVTGVRTVTAKSLPDALPENPDLVRIKKYWQKWTVQPMKNGYVHVTVEGFVDPDGKVPSWLYNLIVPDIPLKALIALRERTLSDKPANN